MKKVELIRKIFDYVFSNGEQYSHSDAISSGCTKDGLANRVFVKKVNVNMSMDGFGHRCDNVTITGLTDDLRDATDADVRITFLGADTAKHVLYANEVDEKTLQQIYDKIIGYIK
jgi:hypothetical protein